MLDSRWAEVLTLSCALMTVMVFGNGLGIVRPSSTQHPHPLQQQYRPLRHHFGRPSAAAASSGRPYPAPISALLIEDHIITTDPVVMAAAPNPCALVIPGLAGKSAVIDRLNLAKYLTRTRITRQCDAINIID